MLVNLGFILVVVGGLMLAGADARLPWIGVALVGAGIFLLLLAAKQSKEVPQSSADGENSATDRQQVREVNWHPLPDESRSFCTEFLEVERAPVGAEGGSDLS